jgi:hypothetical protein
MVITRKLADLHTESVLYRIAAAWLRYHPWYGYTDASTGQKYKVIP